MPLSDTAAAPPPSASEIFEVRAVRLPPRLSEGAFAIRRIDGAALAQAPRLDQILETTPGVSLFRRTSSLGANPTTQGVSLRGIAGSGASRALVTLDGVPQNDPFGGWVIWTALSPLDLAGADIVRGAGAGPYGAGALTGTIALDSARPVPGAWRAEISAGDHGQQRGSASVALPAPNGELILSGGGEHSDGWVPVRAGAGAADTKLWLDDGQVSARYLADLGPGALSARAAAFEEDRGAGLALAGSRARGAAFSASYTVTPAPGHWGWRAQGWSQISDLDNRSVSVAAGRASTSLSNDEYSTPAVGWGASLALRRALGQGEVELGADLRGAAADDHEHFKAVAGVLTLDRHVSGQSLTGGLYAELTQSVGGWLLTGSVRADDWRDLDNHRQERSLKTGAVTLDKAYADQGGVLPSFRLGARRALWADGGYVRAAAYSGFRAPTLNELDRPFRVGNDITKANPALSPEKLYGAEVGLGQDGQRRQWSATAFYNRLDNAIANVTVAHGPYLDASEGFVPAGGTLYQRRNITAIEAYGVELDAQARFTDRLSGHADLDLTHARVDGGSSAAQLTGLRPAQTPRIAATLGARWAPVAPLSLSAELRYEGLRFDDDLNTRRINPGTAVNVRADWRLTPHAGFYLAADNLFDALVPTGKTASSSSAPGVVSYDAPRIVRVGFTLRGG